MYYHLEVILDKSLHTGRFHYQCYKMNQEIAFEGYDYLTYEDAVDGLAEKLKEYKGR